MWAVYEGLIRPARPGKPLLELSPQGIRLRTVGDLFIPWREVRGVDAIDLKTWPARTAPFPVTYANLTVVQISRDFYEAAMANAASAAMPPVMPGMSSSHTFLPKGRWVQVALHHDILPVDPDTLRREVAARWHAFRGPDRPAPAGASEVERPVEFRVNWDRR